MVFNEKEKKEYLSWIEEAEPLIVAAHGDPDGIMALCLLLGAGIKIAKTKDPIRFPYIFGNVGEDVPPLEMPTIALDFGQPLSREFTGVVLDHHDHSSETELWYKLIHRFYPTTLIVYELLKERIPDEHRWKVVIGLVGDGQPERIPDEIWDQYGDILLEETGRMSRAPYKKTFWSKKVYQMISSPLNALCKTGHPYDAFVIANQAKDPWDILDHPRLMEEQENLRKEVDRLLTGAAIRVKKDIVFISVESDNVLCGRIATILGSNDFPQRTFVVVNAKNGSISFRGHRAKYLANKLRASGFQAGGHPGFCGGNLGTGQSTEDLWNTIRKVM